MNPNSFLNYEDYLKEKEFRSSQAIASEEFEANKENFFNHKKKKGIYMGSLFFIAIIFVVIKVLLNVSLIDFFKKISEVRGTKYFLATMIIGFSTFFVCDVFLRIRVLKDKLKEKVKHIKPFEGFHFSVISTIIQSITPFSIGSEPYSIWGLGKKGISMREAGAVISVISFCGFLGQFIVTGPSFIYITVHNYQKIKDGSITTTYGLIFVGLLIDILISVFIFVISYVKKAHFQISRLINLVKRGLGLHYSTHDELFQKYLQDSHFQSLYVKYLIHKSTPKVLTGFILNNLGVYGTFVLANRLFNNDSGDDSSTINSFNLINVSTTATNFVPLPSAEGSLQSIIKNLMSSLPVSGGSNGGKFDEGTILLGRCFCKYFGLLVSLVVILLFGFNGKFKFQKYRSKENSQKNQIPLELTF